MAVQNSSTHQVITSALRQPIPTVFRLEVGELAKVHRNSQTVRVISGCAWLTFDSEDFIVKRGEAIQLTPGRGMAVIGSLFNRSLVYEVSST